MSLAISEMFGSPTQDGFAELATLDTNADAAPHDRNVGMQAAGKRFQSPLKLGIATQPFFRASGIVGTKQVGIRVLTGPVRFPHRCEARNDAVVHSAKMKKYSDYAQLKC
jgi:hypothetical protein